MVKPYPSTSGWWDLESRQTLRANVFQRKILKNGTLRIEKVGILNPCLTQEYIFPCEENIINKPLINRLSKLSWTALKVQFRSLLFLSNKITLQCIIEPRSSPKKLCKQNKALSTRKYYLMGWELA